MKEGEGGLRVEVCAVLEFDGGARGAQDQNVEVREERPDLQHTHNATVVSVHRSLHAMRCEHCVSCGVRHDAVRDVHAVSSCATHTAAS
jgi:hypothetical protein